MRVVWVLLACVGCGGGVAASGEVGQDDAAASADAGEDTVGRNESGDALDEALTADAALSPEGGTAGEASALDAGAEASCYNAAGLWVCDGGWPGADQ